jgi:hypothetical protein
MVKQPWRTVLVISGVILITYVLLTIPVHIPLAVGFRTPATAAVPSTPLVQGVEIVQQLPATGVPIEAIAIQLATYKRINVGTVRLTVQVLRGGQWQILATQTMRKDQLQDNAFQSFRFASPLVASAGERLAIAVTADGDSSQAISWWIDPTLPKPATANEGSTDSSAISDYINPNSHQVGYQLLVNGVPQPGMAVFSITYVQESGPLVILLPALWRRLTVFLDPIWQAFLLLGVAMIILTPLLWLAEGYIRRVDWV